MCVQVHLGLPSGLCSKESACSAGDVGSIPGLGRSPRGGNGNLSSTLAWEILWTEEPSGLQLMGSQTSWTQLSDYRTTKSSIQTYVLYVGSAKKVCCEFLGVRRIYIYYFYIFK